MGKISEYLRVEKCSFSYFFDTSSSSFDMGSKGNMFHIITMSVPWVASLFFLFFVKKIILKVLWEIVDFLLWLT